MRLPPNEKARLAALRSYGILDTPQEQSFDDITALAAETCGCPIAHISFVDYAREWSKAHVGLYITDCPRADSFTAETILGDCALIVPDATTDTRFSTIPYVADTPHVRFYAGTPIITAEGLAIGCLSVMDTAPRQLSNQQLRSLEALARQILALLELRLQISKYEGTIRALGESERRFRNIADASPMLMWISDEMDNRTFFNKAWCEFTGMAREDGMADGWLQAIHPDDRDRYRNTWRAAAHKREKMQQEYRLRHASGTYRWVLEQSVPMRSSVHGVEAWVSSCVDLSSRNANEVEYQRNEARFRAVSEAAPLGIFVTDTHGHFIYTNHQLQEIIGLEGESTLGSKWTTAIHSEDRVRVATRWSSAISSNTPFEESCRFVKPSGDITWCRLKAAIINSADTVSGWVGIVEDITDSHYFQQELVEAKQKAEAAMHAKSQFLANMSHEMRTPLTAIMGFAESMLQDVDHAPQERHCLQVIVNNGNHLFEVINDILDLSKLDAGAMTIEENTFELIGMMEEVRSMFAPRIAEKALSFSVHYEWPLPRWIKSDELRLKQIVINLLSNSIKFTEKGWIEVRVAFEARDNQVSITVTDSGIGMTLEQKAKLFQPFSQANESITRKYGGTGLGLTISRRLAHALEGDITVTSEPGRGSTFKVFIHPEIVTTEILKEAPDQPDSSALVNPALPPRLQGRVLFADDAVDNRKLVEHLLKKVGISPLLVEDGNEAIKAVLSQPFDLVLLDIQMPNLDGLSAARTMRLAGIKAPIVALSAGTMTSDVLQSVEAGCSMHMGKPFTSQAFFEMLARFLPLAEPRGADSAETVMKKVVKAAADTVIVDAEMIPLLSDFIDRLPTRVEDLKVAFQENKPEKVQLFAHRLKGSAGLYGFPELAKLSATLENDSKANNQPQAEQLFREICETIEAICQRKEEILSERAGMV
jgi:PAS domain S-box-containing protein